MPPAARAWLLVAAVALVWLQIALGGWVSTNYAVLACTDFPACQGSWWPPMDFAPGLRALARTGQDRRRRAHQFAALTAIHYVHRLMAYLVLAVAGGRWPGSCCARAPLRRQARWLAGLALLQLATGLANVVLGWPLAAAVAHTGGAAALVVVLTWALCESRRPQLAARGWRRASA